MEKTMLYGTVEKPWPQQCCETRYFCVSETSGLPRLRLFLVVHDTTGGLGAVRRSKRAINATNFTAHFGDAPNTPFNQLATAVSESQRCQNCLGIAIASLL
jgi:hypothetical protein